MIEPEDKFEKFLLNKMEAVNNMLSIIRNPEMREAFIIQRELLDDIIHHYQVIVKGKILTSLGGEE